MPKGMRYLTMRLGCLVRGHDWREASGSTGVFRRCRQCHTERARRKADRPAVAR
jgi:hypothetical protein